MLKISKLSDYGTVIMSYLATQPSELFFSAGDIAQAVHLPVPTVSKVLKILLEADLLLSTRGAGGGYRLNQPAAEINLAQIVMAIEGNLAITECCSSHTCTLDTLCSVKHNWQIINSVVMQTLKSISLQNMLTPLSPQTIQFQGIPIIKQQGNGN